MTGSRPEAWLRGPVEGVPPLLQPVAHALLQAAEEVDALLDDFPEERLWERPAGAASAGFHLQHLRGVVDRLFTYARGEALSAAGSAAEGRPPEPPATARALDARGSRRLTSCGSARPRRAPSGAR
jgi:hypothetical protein